MNLREGLTALYDLGAHILPLAGKRPILDDWLECERPTVDELLEMRRTGRADGFGIVPASVDCVVIDIDGGGMDALLYVVRTLGKPLAQHSTSTVEKHHLWYRASAPEPNAMWHDGESAAPLGDIRGAHGQVKMWQPVKALEAARLAVDATPVDLGLLPRWKKRKRPVANTVSVPRYRAKAEDKAAASLWASQLAKLEAAPNKTRNNTLNDVALCLIGLEMAGRAQGNAHDALVAACEVNGLAADGMASVEATIASARSAAHPIHEPNRTVTVPETAAARDRYEREHPPGNLAPDLKRREAARQRIDAARESLAALRAREDDDDGLPVFKDRPVEVHGVEGRTVTYEPEQMESADDGEPNGRWLARIPDDLPLLTVCRDCGGRPASMAWRWFDTGEIERACHRCARVPDGLLAREWIEAGYHHLGPLAVKMGAVPVAAE